MMRVIADPETNGVETACLAIDWRLPSKCMVKDCTERTYAIVAFCADEMPDGKSANVTICKKHHDESVATDKFYYTIVFP